MERPNTGTRKPLGRILMEGAFVKPQELDGALDVARQTKKKLGEVLVEQKIITPETLAIALGFQLGLPLIDLKQSQAQPAALELIPEDMAKQHLVLPLSLSADGKTLTVAMEEPDNRQLLDTLSFVSNKLIRPVILLQGDEELRKAIATHYATWKERGRFKKGKEGFSL